MKQKEILQRKITANEEKLILLNVKQKRLEIERLNLENKIKCQKFTLENILKKENTQKEKDS